MKLHKMNLKLTFYYFLDENCIFIHILYFYANKMKKIQDTYYVSKILRTLVRCHSFNRLT